jgi:hypothetical protein
MGPAAHEGIPALITRLTDEDPHVRASAAYALSRIVPDSEAVATAILQILPERKVDNLIEFAAATLWDAKKGVRQSCPHPAELYSTMLELFADRLKENPTLGWNPDRLAGGLKIRVEIIAKGRVEEENDGRMEPRREMEPLPPVQPGSEPLTLEEVLSKLQGLEETFRDDTAVARELVAVRQAIKYLTSPLSDIQTLQNCSDSSPMPASPTAAAGVASVLEAANQLEASLTGEQEPMVAKIQGFLDQLVGRDAFGPGESKDAVCAKVNHLADQFGMRLLYRDEPVTVRFLSLGGSGSGVFEARTATRSPRTRYKRGVFPLLQAARR